MIAWLGSAVTAILTFISRGFGSIFGYMTLLSGRELLNRTFMLTLLTVVFPIVIGSMFHKFAFRLLTMISDKFPEAPPAVLNLTGLAAWFADCLQLPASLSVFLGFVSMSLTMRLMTPFTKF